MTVTLSRPRSSGTPDAEELRLGVGRSKRRPWLAVGSVALIATCAAVFTNLYVREGHRSLVIVVTRFVPPGSQIEPDDIKSANISSSPELSPILAVDAVDVIGRRAAVGLVPGTLLTRAELAAGQWPPTGLALVGVTAKPGQLPASGVSPGETVDVVLTEPAGAPFSSVGSPGATGPAGEPDPYTLVHHAVVSDVVAAQATSGTDTVVTVVVPISVAGAVANASAAGQVAIIVVNSRS